MSENRFDLLGRQEFVDRMLTIAEVASANKKNICYAVNGDWGVGKTFVLDMFEDQVKEIGQEGSTLSKYLIFRYNCWEYDYYDEPLVAIVAAMLDQINEKVDLLSDDAKTRIISILKAVGKGLAKKAVQLIEDKTGVNLDNIDEIVRDGAIAVKDDVKDAHEYDQYFGFKKNLNTLKKTLVSLSEDQTVIFIVDELDRCLPEYTIKVLERLHHLFDGIPNVQVIISIDKHQLEHIVCQIYGEKTDVRKYFCKFIDFDIKLETGTIKDHFDHKFANYVSKFQNTIPSISVNDVEDFKGYILDGIDMRNRISIIGKCELLHTILCPNEIMDFSYMCLEILFVLISFCEINLSHEKSLFRIDRVFRTDTSNALPSGLIILSKKYENNQVSDSINRKIFAADSNKNYINGDCLYGVLLFAYRSILGFNGDYIQHGMNISNAEKNPMVEYGLEFWKLLRIIR